MRYFFCLLFFLSCFISCSLLSTDLSEKIKFNDSKYKFNLIENPIKRTGILENDRIIEYRFVLKDSSIIYFSKSNNGSDLLSDFLDLKDYIHLLDDIYFEKTFRKDNKSYLIVKDKGLIYGFSNLDSEKEIEYENFLKKSLIKIK